ncbi:MAG TPA: SLC45 family MFS transporter, partial [Firmicutes bacterium]|nr:SLC45 family MFS transporter [Bacillota bacterium]
PMVVEMAKGADIGKYTGYYYTASMSAQILTPIVSGFFMEHVGYWTLFPYATFFSILAFITMSQVRHGDSNAVAAKSKLELFDVD